MPPSVNNLFPTGKNGVRFTSKQYTAWKEEAERALAYQKRPKEAFMGRVSAEYRFSFKSKKMSEKSDVENFSKAVSDFLEKQGIIGNDSQIDRMLLIRQEPGQRSVFITLEEMT